MLTIKKSSDHGVARAHKSKYRTKLNLGKAHKSQAAPGLIGLEWFGP